MIFYYAPTACSIAPHIALEETGVPFEPRRIDLAKNEQRSDAFLTVNPVGRVPVLILDGQVVTEVPALLNFIANLKPELGLVPAAGTLEFARCFEWLAFLSSTLHVTYAQFRRPERFVSADFPAREALSDEGRRLTIDLYNEVERRLSGGWAAGNSYSIADMYLYPFYTWAWRLDLDMERDFPKWTALVEQLRSRPAVQRALGREANESVSDHS